MANLEIHGPGGTLQTVRLPSSGSLLIGSDAVCDVQILDSAVEPIHARLKLSTDKNQIEATPEGKSVRINGKRVAQGTFQPGDELVLGSFRIVFEGQNPKPQSARKPASKPIEEPLELDWDDIAEPEQPRQKAKTPGASKKSGRSSPDQILAADVIKSAKPVQAVPEPEKISWLKRMLGQTGSSDPIVTVASDSGRGLTVFAEEETTGRKLATAPLIILLSLTLVFLSATAIGLWWIIDRTRANRAYESGIAMYDAGDFRTSSERFQNFLRMRPDEERSSTALVLEVLSRLRELAEGSSPQLSAALSLAEKELPPLVEEPAWQDRQMNAAEIVATLTRDLAARAKQTASAETADQARTSYRLHASLAGDAAEAQRTRLKVDQIMAEAEASVAKGEARNRTLAAMDEALKAKNTLAAFRSRDSLLDSYPELISDTGISKRLDQANQQVKDNVEIIKLNRDAQNMDPDQTLGEPQTLFIRSHAASNLTTQDVIDPKQIVVTAGAGLTVGLDLNTGKVLWQKPSGADPGFTPLLIPEESPPSVLTYDDRDQSLLRLAIADGRTIWRQALGDTPVEQPLVLGNRLLLALPSRGEILWFDLGTGAIRDGLSLKWPLAGSIVPSANNQTLYVPADQSVLFVIQVEPKSCLRSVYVGHRPGTMPVRPVRSGRFLMLSEQRALRTGFLQTWLLEDRPGVAPQRLQQEPIEGWPVYAPGQQGNLLWVSHDLGGFSIFSIGDYTLAKPLSLVGKSLAIDAPAHATSVIPIGQREAIVADRTLKHYRLDPQSGKLSIEKSWELPVGELAEPIRKIDDYRYVVVMSVHRDLGRTVLLFDIRQDEPSWVTNWGTPLELAEEEVIQQKLTWVEPWGRSFQMDVGKNNTENRIEWFPGKAPLANDSDDDSAKPIRWNWHQVGKVRIGMAGEYPNQIQIRESGASQVRRMTLPVETSIPPLLMDDRLIIAGSGGEISLASAKDGSPLGQPFIPDYEKSAPWHWAAMVGLEDQSIVLADQTGRLIRLVMESDPLRLRQSARAQLEGNFTGQLVSTGRAVLAGLSDGSVVSLAGRDLSVQATWRFPGAGTRTYTLNQTNAMICHPSGLIRLVDESGQTRTETQMTGAMPFGRPIMSQDTVLWLTQKKHSELIQWKMSEQGASRFSLKTWVMGPLIPDGDDWLVVERPGMVRKIPREALSDNPAEKPAAETTLLQGPVGDEQ